MVADTTSTPAAHTGAAPSALNIPLILVCSLAYFFDGLIHTIMGPLAPEIATELQLSHAQMGPIFSANLIGQCIGLMTVPMLVGRLGHRWITVVTLIGFGLFEVLVGFAESAQQLFMLRMVTGYFLGGCLPSCLAIVTALAPARRRGFAVTLLFTGYGLGSTVAGVVAGVFAAWGGWRAASIVVGIVCMLSAVVAWRWLVEPPTRQGSAANPVSTPLRDALALMSRPYAVGTLMLWLLFIAMLTVNYCLFSWLPTMLVEVGREASIAAMSVSIFSLGGIIAALGVGLLIDKFGAMRILVSFLLIAAALLFVCGQVMATASTAVLLGLLGAGGFFFLGAYGGVNVVLTSYYPDWLRAIGIGWAKSVGRIGTIIAPILIGFGLSAGMAETTLMSLSALPTLLAVLALLVIAVVTCKTAADDATVDGATASN
ncbi:MAG: MFS transporter [Gammaproteobacteria bacterium]|nr:MFS transporter [Gammaproteobacteria bacterium]